jgi:TetR/AcrR family transcriptional regulator, repressor for neighboring sulfatase
VNTQRRPVERALLEATMDMLAEVGPRAMSVREVAARAGVNHGQVHHYFGSKDALVRAAMRELAAEHFRNAMARAGASQVPPALSLAEDGRYWKAVVRMMLDGELDIARTEVDDGISVPRHALEVLSRRRGLEAPDLDTKTAVAATAALQLGWVALEEFMFVLADVPDRDHDAVRARIREIATRLYDGVPSERQPEGPP